MIRAIALALLLAAPARANFTLTITTSGAPSPSIVYSSNPATGINCGSSSTACSASFASGSTVTLTEIAGSTVVFAGWSGAQGCGANTLTCRVVMAGASAVTAKFDPMMTIVLNGNGFGTVRDGTGTVNCASINGCIAGGTQTYHFAKGTAITLTRTIGSSSTFVGWNNSLGGCSTASTCAFTLSGYAVIVATFNSTGPFTIKSVIIGSGTVISSPAGINCGAKCAAQFSSGTVVHLSTYAAAGYRFAGWSNGGCSGLTPCIVVSSTVYQGLGGKSSPAAFFYKN